MKEMKLLRYVLAMMFICMLSGMAKANDFRLTIPDAGGDNPSFNTTSITSTPVDVTFAACVTGEVGPGANLTYDGCASFLNSTGSAITSLELVFPNVPTLGGQTVNCALDGGTGDATPSGGIDFFQDASCSLVGATLVDGTLVGGDYILDFSDGTIADGAFFNIAEQGVAPGDFPPGTLTATPEPGSIWLLSTGVLLLGGFFYYKRRNGFGAIGL